VLLARIRALLRRGRGARPVVIEVGSLAFDPAAYVFSLDGTPIELTTREAAMLEYLMRQHPRTVPKSELLEHVWHDADTGENAVEVYAGYLRRKLGKTMLRTVRGAGYRLAT
jgi:DNA-binding response OmpR family regulator